MATFDDLRIFDNQTLANVTFEGVPADRGNVGAADNFLYFTSGATVPLIEFAETFDGRNLGGFLNPVKPDTITTSPIDLEGDLTKTNVFNTVTVVDRYVIDAITGIQELRGLLGNHDVTKEDGERALFASLNNYLDLYMTGDEINEIFPKRQDQITRFFPSDSDKNGKVFVRPKYNTDEDGLKDIRAAADDPAKDIKVLHTKLFEAGRVVMEDSRTAQRLRHDLVRLRRARQNDLEQRRRKLATLEREIVDKRRRLDALNSQRLEALGDAQAVQALAVENWSDVEGAYARRERIIEDNDGLYYTRVRETPVSRTLPDPLPLRPTRNGDLVPGCVGNEDKDLPEELEPLFELVLEIPIRDWAALRGRERALPSRSKLDAMNGRRQVRMEAKQKVGQAPKATTNHVRLDALYRQAATAAAEISDIVITVPPSLTLYQRESAKVLSLEDLIVGPAGPLRRDAERLRGQLERAVLCMQDRLQAVPAGIRLIWAEAAEADRLPVDQPDRWPGLDLMADVGLNDLRTLFDLIGWWFERLHREPTTRSASAMRTMIRAVLMLSAGDDPHDLLHGTVTVSPAQLLPGIGILLALNREAIPGATLQLIDEQSRIVGLLNLEDQDDKGAYATVTKVIEPDAVPDTRFTVVGRRNGEIGL